MGDPVMLRNGASNERQRRRQKSGPIPSARSSWATGRSGRTSGSVKIRFLARRVYVLQGCGAEAAAGGDAGGNPRAGRRGLPGEDEVVEGDAADEVAANHVTRFLGGEAALSEAEPADVIA